MTTQEIADWICQLTAEIRLARSQGINFIPEQTAAEIGRIRWREENERNKD